MTIRYTNHALQKFRDLKALGISVTKHHISSVVLNPLHNDRETDAPNVIASGYFDTQHELRVVYRTEGDIMLVITFYPIRKGRYVL